MNIAEKLIRAKEDYDAVYGAGYEKGKAEGGDSGGGSYDQGYADGKKSEHERFWDRYQKNGTQTSYSYEGAAFVGTCWSFDNFYPKYDIKPVGNATRMFYNWRGHAGGKGSLSARLKECGVVLDTSETTILTSAFSYGVFTEIPTIDCRKLDGSSLVFSSCYDDIDTIEKLIVAEGVTYDRWFNGTNVKNITFEGTIGQNLNMSTCTRLTRASIENIIGCLSDTASEKTLTLSKAAVESAFGDSTVDVIENVELCLDFGGNDSYNGELSYVDGVNVVTLNGEGEGGTVFLSEQSYLPAGSYVLSFNITGNSTARTLYIDVGSEHFEIYDGGDCNFTVEDESVSIYFDVDGTIDATLNVELKRTARVNEWDVLKSNAQNKNWTITEL